MAAEADVQRLQSILVDLVLVSPRSGRVQYRLARAGEVVAAGQRVLTIFFLKDVYMISCRRRLVLMWVMRRG